MANNRFELTGNVSKVGIHEDRNGNEFAVVELATNESYTGKDGKTVRPDPVWHSLVVFSPYALEPAKTLSKGDFVRCKGTIDYRTHQFDTEQGKRTLKEASLKCNWMEVITKK